LNETPIVACPPKYKAYQKKIRNRQMERAMTQEWEIAEKNRVRTG